MWCRLRGNFVDNGIWLILAVLMSDRRKEGGVAAQICPGGKKLALVGVWLTPALARFGVWLTAYPHRWYMVDCLEPLLLPARAPG